MDFHTFRLRPQGGFHFGAQGIELEPVYDICHSDTLYAALTWQAIIHQRPWAAAASTQQPVPPFKVSSGFPYIGTTQLLPRPSLPVPPASDAEQRDDDPAGKKIKKLRFVSLSIFRELVQGVALKTLYPAGTASDSCVLLQDSEVLVRRSELPPGIWDITSQLWKISAVPHVTVDRITNFSTYFEVGELRFHPLCGLGLLATGDVDELRILLGALGLDGLGGRRTKGMGQFTLESAASVDLPAPHDHAKAVLLSRYIPRPDELSTVLGPAAAYSMERLSGWFYSPGRTAQRRQNIWMINEGSAVHTLGKQPSYAAPQGRIVDLAPSYGGKPSQGGHAVWRHGLAFCVGTAV